MSDKYDDTHRLSDDDRTQVGMDDTEIATSIMVDRYDRDPDEVDVFDETHIVDSKKLAMSIPNVEVTDRAAGSILRRSGSRATLDLNDSEPSFGFESEGLDEASEPETFSETSVLPITSDDLDAMAVGDAIDGRFRLLGVLGEGGMGRVYRGMQISINRDVAIKVVLEEFAQDPELRQRFMREAQLISSFTHPNIVRLVDFGETEGRLYLAMEFVNGKPLSALFSKKQLHPRFALQMMRQVSSALIEAHENGVVHRDLKPDNILIQRIADGSAQCKVLDFGVARTSTSDLTAAGTVCGTPDYMAPEQARGATVDGATDLYSVGCMLFEMLAGRLPFLATAPIQMMLKQVNEKPPKLCEIAPHLPAEIGELVDNLLEKDSSNRIASAAYLCEKIDSILETYGWSSTIRVPAGPLIETTKTWLWKPGERLRPVEPPDQWRVGNEAPDIGGSFGQGSFHKSDYEQSDFSPDASFSLDSNKARAPINAPPPENRHEPAPSPNLDMLAPIELDLPEPAPRFATHDATVERPIPEMQQRRVDPTVTQDRPRTAPRGRPVKKDSTNTLLMVVLVLMILASGAVAYWLFVIKPGADTETMAPVVAGAVLTGESKRIVDHFTNAGWTSAAPPSIQDLGDVKATSLKLAQASATLRIDIYTCPTKEDVRTIFKQRAFPPRKGFHYGETVVVLEADSGTSAGYTAVALDLLKKLEPNAVTSVSQL